MAEVIDLTKGLRAWAIRNDITPTLFAKKTGYKYAYAWDLLRGKGEFTQEGLGRISMSFGIGDMAEILRFAGDDRIIKVEMLPAPDKNAQTVPVISVQVRKIERYVTE